MSYSTDCLFRTDKTTFISPCKCAWYNSLDNFLLTLFYLLLIVLLTCVEEPGEVTGAGHGPSCSEKCARKTMSLEKAPRTSALGHSSRYSGKRVGNANKTLCANQLRTFLLWRSRMHKASYLDNKQKLGKRVKDKKTKITLYTHTYQSLAGPLTTFLVWNPVVNRNLAASWILIMAISSASGSR